MGTFRSFMWTGNETISFSTFQLLVIPLLLWCPAQAHGIKTQLHPGGFKIRILQKCWKRTEGRHKRTKKTSNTCLTILKEYMVLWLFQVFMFLVLIVYDPASISLKWFWRWLVYLIWFVLQILGCCLLLLLSLRRIWTRKTPQIWIFYHSASTKTTNPKPIILHSCSVQHRQRKLHNGIFAGIHPFIEGEYLTRRWKRLAFAYTNLWEPMFFNVNTGDSEQS